MQRPASLRRPTPLIRRVGAVRSPLDHLHMDEPTKPSDTADTSDASDEAAGLRDYWTVFCAALLIAVVVYAVMTAN